MKAFKIIVNNNFKKLLTQLLWTIKKLITFFFLYHLKKIVFSRSISLVITHYTFPVTNLMGFIFFKNNKCCETQILKRGPENRRM